MNQHFEYNGVTAIPTFIDVRNDEGPDIKKFNGWELFKDGEQITSPAELKIPEDVKKWIDENVSGTN